MEVPTGHERVAHWRPSVLQEPEFGSGQEQAAPPRDREQLSFMRSHSFVSELISRELPQVSA